MDDFELQLAFQAMSTVTTPLQALKIYEKYFNVLKEWRFICAAGDDQGPFKLKNKVIDNVVGIRSIFKGQSLWVIDASMVEKEGTVPYLAGTGIYFDSNAASYIYSLGYKDKFQPQLKNQLLRIQSLGIDYKNINPYLYLFESRTHFDRRPENIEFSRKTFAALTALSKIGGSLDESWREMYQKYFMDQCEANIEPLFNEFIAKHESGAFNSLDHLFALTELLLLETKILDISSKKKNEDKLEDLIYFMDEKLQIMMLRELAICADILFRGNKTQLTTKLLKVNAGHPNSLGIVQGCAWDLFIFRVMDWFSNTSSELHTDFYISNLVSCDRDIWDIADLTMLKAIALHNRSFGHVIFPEHSPEDILATSLGKDKQEFPGDLFSYSSRQKRIGWIQREDRNQVYATKSNEIQGLLQEKRMKLLSIIRN